MMLSNLFIKQYDLKETHAYLLTGVRLEDPYHSHDCMLNVELEPGMGESSLA